MKSITLLLCAFGILSITGCNNNDDDDNNNNATGLTDTWTLASVDGGFLGSEYEYEKSVITANFESDGDVIVVNNNTDESKPDFLESGSYDYTVANNETQMITCTQSMMIGSSNFQCYHINENDELVLDNRPADALRFVFIRN